jgi:hypothetical protein
MSVRNGINNGKYAYNNLQHDDAMWHHKFNAKWHTATEAWYMSERDVPNVAHLVPTETGANGANCKAGLRPELRFNHSWDARGYNAGKSQNQLFFSTDVIFKF